MTTFSNDHIGRRTFLGLMAGGAVLALMPGAARALTDAEARSLIDRVVADINRIINSGQSEAAMYRGFEQIFDRYADVGAISRSALGPPARTASSSQLAAFGDAFGEYLARKYGSRFREFRGSDIIVRDARDRSRYIEVLATVALRGQSPFSVSFIVSDRGGSNRFIDIVIEGISLLRTEQVEIRAMLERRGGNIDRLIQDLRSA